MLDDRQPQSRAAACAAVAFVDTVEPLKHTLLVGRRNANARVGHAHKRCAVFRASFERHAALRSVVGNRVIREVKNHLLQRAALTGHRNRRPLHRQRDLLLRRLMRQSVSHRTAQACQFDRLKRQRAAAFVQP